MAPRKRARDDVLDGLLANYEGTYLDCRNLGHVWVSRGFFRYGNGIRRLLDCQRCGTQKVVTWTSQGERLGASYEYIDGYRAPAGERFSPQQVRVEIIRRAVIYTSQEDLLADLTKGRS
jgi:hypothetical protein